MAGSALRTLSGVAGGFLGRATSRGARAQSIIPEQVRNIISPGGTLNVDPGGTISFDRGAGVTGALGRLRTAGESLAGDLTGLIEQVRPGIGRLTEARRGAISDIFGRRRSDLQASLARRRVLGSSFAEAEANRLAADEARALGESDAQSFLQELELTTSLLTQRAQAQTAGATAELDQSNFETGQTVAFTNAAQAIGAANTRFFSDLAAQGAAGRGALFAQAGGALSDLFFG